MVNHIFAVLFTAFALIPESAWTREDQIAGQENQALSLPCAIQLALSHNRELQAAAVNRQIAAAERLQAGLAPNPEFETEIENFAGSGPLSGLEAAETTLSLGQVLETAGKRGKRREAAGLQENLAQWSYRAKRLDILAETTLAFINVLAMQKRVSLDKDLHDLAQKVMSSVRARVEAGKVSPLEATKAEIAASNARMQWLQNQERLQALRLILSGYWGEDRFRFSRVEGELDHMAEIPPKRDLDALLLDSPDMARWTTEIDYRHAQLRLEKARRVPDLNLKLGYRRLRELNEHAWVAGISLPLPLFNRNQGQIQKAGSLIAQGEIEKKAVENQKRVQLAARLQSLETAAKQATILQEQILPSAKWAFEGTREGYREGKLGYLDVLDAQRTYFEVHIQHLE